MINCVVKTAGFFAVSAALLMTLVVGAPQSAAGQDMSPGPAADVAGPAPAPVADAPAPQASAPVVAAVSGIPMDLPGIMVCESTPYFGLSEQMPFAGEVVGWRAAGLKANAQLSIVATDLMNPQSIVFRTSATGNGWCQAMGIITLPRPTQYRIDLIGVSSTTGEPVTLSTFPYAVIPPQVAPAPTPMAAPVAPSSLRATQVNNTTARLDWSENTAAAASLMITSRAGEYQTQVGTTTMNVGGLAPNQVYCFTIFAVNDAGRSPGGADCLNVKPMVTP